MIIDCLKEMPLNPTFIFIDGSYFCFYRYHSLLTWWKNAYPEQIDVLQDPYQNETFVEKFKKTFIENIQKIPKNLKIDKSINPITIVGKDCKRSNIWRNELFPNYKTNRANGPEDGFMGGPFFQMVYEENLFIQGGARSILKHPKLEADDCIAISVKYLLNNYPTCNIFIITSDKDYLQLAQERVQIYNLAYKKLTEQKSSTGNPECDLFCKILMGDLSDNIPSVLDRKSVV
jgi:5'-3' exonuclease